MKDRCEICFFARKGRYTMQGYTALDYHNRPPKGRPLVGWSYRDQGVWPEVAENDWCGEFKPVTERK